MELNIFEKANSQSIRFTTSRGSLSTEDLFDLPLQSTRPERVLDLDTVARTAYNELQQIAMVSFVESRPNPAKAELELKLAVVKRVIEIKQAQNAEKVQAAARDSERARLKDLIARKKDAALEGEDLMVLEARLAALS